MTEQVFCLARSDLQRLFGTPLPSGIRTAPPLEQVLNLPHYFLLRDRAENAPEFKQIIPYQIFRCKNRFFTYQRGSKVGEQRLTGRLSMGIGGHLNSKDSQNGVMTFQAYMEGLLREQVEELADSRVESITFAGWINDESDAVGQVHLGAVHVCQVADPKNVQLRTNGEDITLYGWLTAEEITERKERFEPWSILALALASR